MASIKEIRTHIRSVEQTLKITNAMYLISSANLRKARAQLNSVEPYFNKIETTISDILHHSPEISHPFFDKRPELPPEARKAGYIVVSGDKGLAGAYNHNILKLAEGKLARHPGASLFVVGQVGRSYFQEHHIPIDAEFLYTAQNPTIARARDIAETMMDLFLERRLDDVYVLFTRLVTSFDMEPTVHKLLPLDPDVFPEYEANRDTYNRDVTYVPSVKAVMDGRKKLKENGIPYLRPDDYLAEMVKDDKKMKLIEQKKSAIEEEKRQKLRKVIIRNKNKKRSNRKKYSRR